MSMLPVPVPILKRFDAILEKRAVVERTYILAVTAFMTLLVGLSRVALGVHWATDVLAGWAYGFGWALFWLLLARTAVGGGPAETDPDDMARP